MPRCNVVKFHKNPPNPLKPKSEILNLMFGESRMMTLGSEGVYLDEKCHTNPSRHLPGPKTVKPRKKLKNTDFGVWGFRVLGSRGFRGFEKLPINRLGRPVCYIPPSLRISGTIHVAISRSPCSASCRCIQRYL